MQINQSKHRSIVKTPHLDQIAAQGLVFDRAYLTTSSCSPSRSSIITGRYPHNTGAPELHLKLSADQVTFVQLLKAAGYHTLLSGKNHMGDPEMLGFEEVSDGGDHSGSADWVELLRNRPILELAGIEPGPTFQGVSMVPILENPQATVRDFAFAEHNWHVFAAHERSVRFGDWLFIRNAFPHKAAMSLESDDSYTPAGHELWGHYRSGHTLPWQEDVMRVPRPEYELFHVGIDPHQFHNLAGQSEFAQVETQLRAVLENWAEATGDTVPAQPTPDRAPGPRPKADLRGELPGASREATRIHSPGPIRDTGEWMELDQ